MKNLYSGIVAVLLVGLTNGYAQQRTEAYDFPVKPGTGPWHALRSYQEKRDVCKIPERILSTISTKALIETYLHYPLLADIAVFRTLQEGTDKLQENFNGAQELLRRKDAGKLLLEYYRSMKPQALDAQWSLVEKGNYSFKIMAIEILLAQDNVLASLDIASRKTLLKIANEKLEAKKTNQEVYGTFSYTSTGWIMARILRDSNYAPFMNSLTQQEKHKVFVEQGFAFDNATVDDVVNHTQKFLLKN